MGKSKTFISPTTLGASVTSDCGGCGAPGSTAGRRSCARGRRQSSPLHPPCSSLPYRTPAREGPSLARPLGQGLGSGREQTAWLGRPGHTCAEDMARVPSGAGRVGCALELSSPRPGAPRLELS